MTFEGLKKLAATKQLAEILEANAEIMTPESLETVIGGIQHYRDQFERAARLTDPISAVASFYDVIDDLVETTPVPKPVSCRKGCAFCCHINLDISNYEADLLVEWSADHNIPIDEEYLENQRPLDIKTRAASEYSACVFLDTDNTCKVYAARPVNCRKYRVVSDPARCDFKTFPSSIVEVVAPIQVELVASGMTNVGEHGNIAEMLLQAIQKKKNEHSNGTDGI